jgi:hypothetical protein
MKALNSSYPVFTRHGVLPARYPNSKKNLMDRYKIFEDSQITFSCRRSRQIIVRIWLKITFTGDEVVEILEGVEIPADRQPRRIEHITSTDQDIRWVEKPPLQLYRLKQVIDAGLRFAEHLIVEKAEDLQQKVLKNRYSALERLRIYYRQLAADAAAYSSEAAGAVQAEYRRRLGDEIAYARVKAEMDLIALETISTPVQNLKWLLQQNGNSKEVNAVFNLHDGSLNPPLDRNANSKGDIKIMGQISSVKKLAQLPDRMASSPEGGPGFQC